MTAGHGARENDVKLLERLRSTLASEGDGQGSDPVYARHLAAAVLLLEMEHADHSYEPAERAEIERQLQTFFDLAADEVAGLIASAESQSGETVSLHGFLQALNDGLDPSGKREVLEMLWRVAYADRHLDAHEEHFLRKIADLLHLPHREFIKAKLAVLDG